MDQSDEIARPECGHATVFEDVGFSCNLPADHDGHHGFWFFLARWDATGRVQ